MRMAVAGGVVLALALAARGAEEAPGALGRYVRRADACYAWKVRDRQEMHGLDVATLALVSQKWQGREWRHTLCVARPKEVRRPDIAFLWVAAHVDAGLIPHVKRLAEQAGALVAVLGEVPNQPLFGGKYEDALIAHTFEQYLRTGDETWPLLLPMTKSAVRAMDAVQAWAREGWGQEVGRFVVSGASKRGWTSWLTAAADRRVAGVAPAVIDMLNLKEQTQWAQRVYGRQSEMIHDYTDIGLLDHLGTPAGERLLSIVDPYRYREMYTMPKLLLLGTNDPYWMVDALGHYWDGLPGPKLVYQAPNAGHGAAGTRGALETMAAFYQMVAERRALPEVTWEMKAGAAPSAAVAADCPVKRALLWTANSKTRDFRKAKWSSRALPLARDARRVEAAVPAPKRGYVAFMVELVFTAEGGQEYSVSTQAVVAPEARGSEFEKEISASWSGRLVCWRHCGNRMR